jgi:holliday junction DNA helicase RuvA
MIVGLEGTIEYKDPSVVHINVHGIIYEVFISLQSFSALQKERVKLFTSHIIREDAQLLFGFFEKAEKLLFERLIKINGVGPKVAIAICSTFTPSAFGTIINNADVNSLKKVPGIGPKNAGRILVELSGFDTILLSNDASLNSNVTAVNEATQALESLGFKRDHITKAISGCASEDTASLVKEALKKLQTI